MADLFSTEALASGPSGGSDPTLQPGQYPDSLFGAALPQGTGAGGSGGARPATGGTPVDFTEGWGAWQDRPSVPQRIGGPGDSTTVTSQAYEGISGLGPAAISNSGAGMGSAVSPHHLDAASTPSLVAQIEAARRPQ